METHKATISARIAVAAAVTVSTDETRYYLQGIYIEPAEAGALVVSTDGHRMSIILDDSGTTNRPAIRPIPKAILSAARKRDKMEKVIRFDGDSVTLAYKAEGDIPYAEIMTVVEPEIDGTYPDWRQTACRITIPPVDKRPPFVCVNAEYLGDYAKIAKALGLSATFINIQPQADYGDPMFVTLPGAPHYFGVLMPIRPGQCLVTKIPAWVCPE